MKLLFVLSASLSLAACGGAVKKENVSGETSEAEIFSSYRAYDHFVKGDLCEQSGDYASAADEYRKALIFDPASIEIRRSLSEAYFKQRKFTEAAVARSEISERTVGDYNFIGDCLRFGGDYGGAVEFYRRSLETDPAQVAVRTYLAGLLYRLGDNNEAENQFKAAIDYSDDKIESILELAAFYLRISENDKAMRVYRDALAEKPDDLRPAVGVAALYIAGGDTTSADSVYSSLIRENWDDVEALGSLLPAFYSSQRINKAAEASGRIAELLPDDPEAQRRYAFLLFGNAQYAQAESAFAAIEEKGIADASIYYYHGRLRQLNSDFSNAELYLNQALALDDTLTDAWINLALVADAQGDYKRALDVMQRAYDKVPEDSLAIMFYTAMVHSRNDRFDLARDGYLRLKSSNPENVDFRFNLGAAYERLGQFADAENEFKWIVENQPDHVLALNYLGYMYAERGINLEKALAMIEKAVSLDSENGAFLDSYAWALYKLGRYEEALVQMEKALEHDTSDAVLFDHKGDILAALNSPELARASWEKALEIDPDNQDIRAKLSHK